ncbi:hypothetical protein DBR42_03295 [Pelomonas sp. HMWF004]|nr:hypothetical protein DBR42_03295 [Pelomonas sp. HMWF004]
MSTSRVFLAAAAAAALVGSFTAASASDLSASADVVRSTVAGHPYQNGGIGRDEVADMGRHQQAYDLHLTFSEGARNAYAAGLALRITDTAGQQVFGLRSAGPQTDVSLPAGRYHVAADLDGVVHTAVVDVSPSRPADLHLHWLQRAG